MNTELLGVILIVVLPIHPSLGLISAQWSKIEQPISNE
jgi:hypothetical protein